MLYLPKIDGKIYCCMIRKHVCMCNCVDVAIWALVLSSWLKMSAFGVESFYTAFMIQGNRYLPKEVNNLVFRLIDPFFGDFLLPLPWQHRGVYFVPTLLRSSEHWARYLLCKYSGTQCELVTPMSLPLFFTPSEGLEAFGEAESVLHMLSLQPSLHSAPWGRSR